MPHVFLNHPRRHTGLIRQGGVRVGLVVGTGPIAQRWSPGFISLNAIHSAKFQGSPESSSAFARRPHRSRSGIDQVATTDRQTERSGMLSGGVLLVLSAPRGDRFALARRRPDDRLGHLGGKWQMVVTMAGAMKRSLRS